MVLSKCKELCSRVFTLIKPTLISLRFSLYVIFHPINGFWELKNEKKGTVLSASLIVFLTLVTRLIYLQHTSFLFSTVVWENVNIWMEIMMILIPLAIWCVSNWCLTTLFDGKGSMKDIYITTSYALTPYILINIPLSILSNTLTSPEGQYITLLSAVAILWCGGLLILGLMMIHDYTVGKTLLFVVASIVGMLVIMVLCLMFFSMTSEAIGFFAAVFKEISIRLA